MWSKYEEFQVPVDKASFREAYVHGERTLARVPLVKPEHNFHDVLRIKTDIQVNYLVEQGKLDEEEARRENYAEKVADSCYRYVLDVLERTRPVVKALSERYKLVLVSNFYGNIQTILKDFGLFDFFADIIESSVVGVRKPDPAIYRLGVEAMGLPAENVLVVGDSFSKDVVPAKTVGCKVAWLKGEGWGNEEIDEKRNCPGGTPIPVPLCTDYVPLFPVGICSRHSGCAQQAFSGVAYHYPYPFGYDSGYDVHGIFHHGHSGRIVYQPSRIP